MNQIEAARETLKKIDEYMTWVGEGADASADEKMHIASLDSSLHPEHLSDMLAQMENNANPQGGEFSEGKLNRWLGWMQAAGVALGALSLEDCKGISKKWAE